MQIDEATYRALKEAMQAQLTTVRRLGENIEAALNLMGDITLAEVQRALDEFDADHPEIVARIGADDK